MDCPQRPNPARRGGGDRGRGSQRLLPLGTQNGKRVPGGGPWAPNSLISLIGVDYFGRPISVWLTEAETDASIEPVERLTRLERMSLEQSPISHAGLVHLQGLSELFVLNLSETQVTDAGLIHLKRLTNLAELSLNGTQRTGAGLVDLKGLAKLAQLELGGTKVTDAALANLTAMSCLSQLELFNTQVTDAGIAHLKGVRSLSYVNLAGTQVTEAGVTELEEALPNLKINFELELRGSPTSIKKSVLCSLSVVREPKHPVSIARARPSAARGLTWSLASRKPRNQRRRFAFRATSLSSSVGIGPHRTRTFNPLI